MKSKPPTAILGETGHVSAILELTCFFNTSNKGKKGCYEKNLHWLQIRGWEKVERGQFYDGSTACEVEIFPTFDWFQETVLEVHA